MENRKYKRRSRDYHENRCEDGYVNEYNDSYRDRNKYKHQYRNDRYDKIRGRPKEKPWSHGDKNCDSSVLTQNLKNCTKHCHEWLQKRQQQ